MRRYNCERGRPVLSGSQACKWHVDLALGSRAKARARRERDQPLYCRLTVTALAAGPSGAAQGR
jgi:hypothetical protein